MEETNKELQERVEAFNKEFIPLLGKYKLGLGAVPFIAADGKVMAKPQLFDDSKEVAAEEKVESEPVVA